MFYPLYAATIGDSLKRSEASTEELAALRDEARAVLKAQGDLAAQLQRLEAELERRRPGAKR